MSNDLKIWNTRMLQLMKEAVGSEMAATKKEWCEFIGIRQSNLIEVESGKRGFTIEQIVKAAEITGVSADWILGLSKTRSRGDETLSGFDLIKEGIRLIELDGIVISYTYYVIRLLKRRVSRYERNEASAQRIARK